MSLSKLPEELVAQVASHLDYEDVWSFMESSVQNYNGVKRYRMDKIKLDLLYYKIFTNGTIEYIATAGRKKYTFKAFNLHEQPIIMLNKMLEQASSIGSLYIWVKKITMDFVQMLKETRTTISFLSFGCGSFELTEADFIGFHQRFNISLDSVDLKDSAWTDEVLCQILPRTLITSCASKNCRNAITDRTLEALTGGDKIQKSRFVLFEFRTSFTIKGILESFEKVRDKKMDEVYWDLGILHSNQSADAMRYFENGDFGQYEVEVSEDNTSKNYKITKHKDDNSGAYFLIEFAVEKNL